MDSDIHEQPEVIAPSRSPLSFFARGYASWVIVALLFLGFVVSLAGIVLAFSVYRMPAGSADRETLGQVAVMGIVVGGGAMCVGLGCLLFGWLGGSPFVSVGSHRSIVATTVLTFVVGALIGVGFLRIVGFTEGDTGKALNAVGASVYGVFLVMVYLQGVRPGLVNRGTLGLTPGRLLPGLAWGVAMAVAATALTAGYGYALTALGVQMDQTQMNELRFLQGKSLGQYSLGDLMAVGMLVVAAPVVEELFFRAYVFNAYLTYKGPITAYVGSSLLFALIHGIPQFLPVFFALACLLALAYRRSGTIVAPIVAHVLNNSLFIVALATGAQV